MGRQQAVSRHTFLGGTLLQQHSNPSTEGFATTQRELMRTIQKQLGCCMLVYNIVNVASFASLTGILTKDEMVSKGVVASLSSFHKAVVRTKRKNWIAIYLYRVCHRFSEMYYGLLSRLSS
eukprot:scaffold37_cov172-Ochromonas_danica.AAC.14